MLCPRCGWTNPDDATECANCQADLTHLSRPSQPEQQTCAPRSMPAVPNYLAWSIVVTVLSAALGSRCCVSLVATAFGVVAIVKSSQANTKSAIGDYAAAMQEALAAKTWMLWSVGVWVASLILTAVFVILYFIFILTVVRNSPSGFLL